MTPVRWMLLLAVLAASALLGVAGGPVALSPAEVWNALLGVGDATHVAIVLDLRLPRVALGVVVGAGLAASGTVLQATLRNPLAEPYLLGVSGGAANGGGRRGGARRSGPGRGAAGCIRRRGGSPWSWCCSLRARRAATPILASC